MFKKFIFIHLVIFSFFFSHLAYASSLFVSDPIWYSKSTFGDGDSIYIHTAIWNDTGSTISGTVQFLDNDTLLGSREVSIANQELKDVSVLWKVTSGDHKISTKFVSLQGDKGLIPKDSLSATSEPIFIPKKIINSEGEKVLPKEVVAEKVKDVLPESVATPVAKSFSVIDDFRLNTGSSLDAIYNDTNKKIENLNKSVNKESTKEKAKTDVEPKNSVSGVEKPIAYVELFLVGIARFIFKQAVLFYIISALVAFVVLRFLYRKMRR